MFQFASPGGTASEIVCTAFAGEKVAPWKVAPPEIGVPDLRRIREGIVELTLEGEWSQDEYPFGIEEVRP